MKYIILLSLFLFTPFSGSAQENAIALSGGYAFQNIVDVDEATTGWRVNLAYEFNSHGGKVVHGFSVGYISTNAIVENLGQQEYNLNSVPIYYAPKFLIGKKSFKGFIKGALGWHFSSYKKTGQGVAFDTNDTGFYGGLGAGVVKTFSEKFFVSLEYEWALIANSFYRNGLMNTINLGIGIKF